MKIFYLILVLISSDEVYSIPVLIQSSSFSPFNSSNTLTEEPKKDYLSINELCQSLMINQQIFGLSSFNRYSSLSIKEVLISQKIIEANGRKNDYFNDLAEVNCKYYIYFKGTKFSIDILEFLLRYIKNCLKKNLQCPGINNDNPSIDDSDSFCSNVENEDFDDLTNEKIYNFLKKEDFFKCKEFAQIFNYFTVSSQILRISSADLSKKILDANFLGYNGIVLTPLNKEMNEKCANMVLPHFSFLAYNNKTDNDGICEDFFKSAIQMIENRIQQMEESKKSELQTKNEIIKRINITEELLNKSNNIITIEISSDKSWANCYGELDSYLSLKRMPSDSLKKTFQDLSNLIIKRLIFSKELETSIEKPEMILNGFFGNIESFTSNLEKIRMLTGRMESFCSFVHDLIARDNQMEDQEDNEEENIVKNFDKNSIEELNNKIMDSKTNFEAFLAFITKNIKETRKMLDQQLIKSDLDDEEYSKAIKNLLEQKKIVLNYKYSEK